MISGDWPFPLLAHVRFYQVIYNYLKHKNQSQIFTIDFILVFIQINTHFYNNVGYSGVPIWSLFEIMTLGDFGFLLSCLTIDVRNDISQRLGINVSADTDRQLVYKYIYTLKDLRNAIAHNSVVFDTRFRNIDPNRAMRRCLEQEIGLSYVNFKSIGDYVILMCYYLKLLGVTKIKFIL